MELFSGFDRRVIVGEDVIQYNKVFFKLCGLSCLSKLKLVPSLQFDPVFTHYRDAFCSIVLSAGIYCWLALCAGSSLCAEGLLQDLRQHGAPSGDRGAAFYRLLRMPRSAAPHTHTPTLDSSPFLFTGHVLQLCSSLSLRFIFRRAPRVHAGPHDRCNQELLPEVPAAQPDLSPASKPVRWDPPPVQPEKGL